MEIINLNWPLDSNDLNNSKIVLAMGLFDGVHLGHQQVIKEAKALADKNNLPLAVLTYYPSPDIFFGDPDRKLITTNQEKVDRFNRLGVDYLYITNINQEFLNLKPQAFVDEFLIRLNPKIVAAGSDHTYGDKNLNADMQHLPEFADDRFEVVSVDLLKGTDGDKYASTKIREQLKNGEIEDVNQNLNYNFSISGEVVEGQKKGRELGFPTINLKFDQDKLIPGDGVYVTITQLNGALFESVTSIGTNPTFENRRRTVETYILDFDQEIYSELVTIKFFDKIRDQIKFKNEDELIKKINADVDFTKSYFS